MAIKRKTLRIQYDSPVVLTFSLLCLGALLLCNLDEGLAFKLFSVYRSSPKDPLTYLRLFTHVLGHASVSHLLGNVCLMLVLGPVVESRYGSKNLLTFIVLTALVTGLLHVALFPSTGLMGASGIVFMLIFLSSVSGMRGGNIPVSLILIALVYLGQEVMGMFFEDDISQLTHIAGGVCGIICGVWLGKRKR